MRFQFFILLCIATLPACAQKQISTREALGYVPEDWEQVLSQLQQTDSSLERVLMRLTDVSQMSVRSYNPLEFKHDYGFLAQTHPSIYQQILAQIETHAFTLRVFAETDQECWVSFGEDYRLKAFSVL